MKFSYSFLLNLNYVVLEDFGTGALQVVSHFACLCLLGEVPVVSALCSFCFLCDLVRNEPR